MSKRSRNDKGKNGGARGAWAAFTSFLARMGRPRRIGFLIGLGAGAAAILAGAATLVILFALPPVTIRLIHPFENPIWRNAISDEAAAFDAAERRYRVEVVGMDYSGVNEAARKPETWDVAIGTSAFLSAEASFARPVTPFTGSIWGIYYNKALLEKAGIAPASGQPGLPGVFASGSYSLADLEQAFAMIKQEGKAPIALGSQYAWPLAIWIQAIIAAGPDIQAASDLPKRDYDLSSPALSAALDKFQTYVDSGFVNEGHHRQDWPSSVRAVVNGDAAFCLVNEGFISALLAPERAKVGYLPLPGSVEGGKTKWIIGSLVYIGRSSKPSSVSGARKLLKHFSSTETSARLSSALSAPFYSGGRGPDRVLPSVASVTTHPLMALLKERFTQK
jgi:ABC-type glycerol-3-phosphate transport system substrate-binding protein